MIMRKTITASRITLVRGDKLPRLGNRIIQIDTTKQYANDNWGVYLCEIDYTGYEQAISVDDLITRINR